jgi:deoxycytidine triphosphate deaminase
MPGQENDKGLNERIEKLEKQVQDLSSRSGGMLSSTDFRRLVIYKGKEKTDYADFNNAFLTRDWKKVGRNFIIEPYDELNLTPFSYDLSIGDEIFSVRKQDRMRKRLPYSIMPGETVIILTREFIALPACYSATVWPRFILVREGIFQSMVKIDPTWYGKLGVAMTNLSSRTIELFEGMTFGTLLLYELSSDTDLDLLRPAELGEVRVKIPNIPLKSTLQGKLEAQNLTKACWVEDDFLVVRGLKKSTYETLRKIDGSKPWLDIVETAKVQCIKATRNNTGRRSIGMGALGMQDLQELTSGSPMGKGIDEKDVKEARVTDKELWNVAVEHGKPFDLLANIPKLVMETIEREITPTIRAEVESSVFPRTVTLTLTVLGFLSLIVAVAAFVVDKFRPQTPAFAVIEWSTTVSVITIVLAIIILVAIVCLLRRRK